MKAIVFSETAVSARELCAGARDFANEVELVTFNEAVPGVSDKCYVVNVPEGTLYEGSVNTLANLVMKLDSQIVLFEPTKRLKTIVGRIAARNHASVVTDVTDFADGITMNRYFGGLAIRSTKSLSPIVFCSVGAGLFDSAKATGTEETEAVKIEVAAGVTLVNREDLPPVDVDLTASKVVVAAGRGFAEEGQLDLARTFAGAIGGELGCTRPLTESENWFPREAYIGVSGLMLTPEVYVGIGTSGQMQHIVGVERAHAAFAINKDPHAPIFDKVDYGLIGEISDVLPKINDLLA